MRKYDDIFDEDHYAGLAEAAIPLLLIILCSIGMYGSMYKYVIWPTLILLFGIFLKMIYEMMRHALAFTIDTILLYKQKRFQKKFDIECQYYAELKRNNWTTKERK